MEKTLLKSLDGQELSLNLTSVELNFCWRLTTRLTTRILTVYPQNKGSTMVPCKTPLLNIWLSFLQLTSSKKGAAGFVIILFIPEQYVLTTANRYLNN